MKNKKKEIPQFKSEQEEREFWKTADSTEYLDWSKGKRLPPKRKSKLVEDAGITKSQKPPSTMDRFLSDEKRKAEFDAKYKEFLLSEEKAKRKIETDDE